MTLNQTERELRAVKEVIAAKENIRQTEDFSNFNQLQMETCIPPEFHHLTEYNLQALEKRKERLERRQKEKCRMSELDPQVVLALVTGVIALLYTGSWIKSILALVFAPVLWYMLISGAIFGFILLFPLL